MTKRSIHPGRRDAEAAARRSREDRRYRLIILACLVISALLFVVAFRLPPA